jgi:PIN domain nuclease of toxin-antitoxin system
VLVLDTNALFSILIDPGRLGKKTRKLLTKSASLYISPVSIFEIAIKNMLGKIKLNQSLEMLVQAHGFIGLPFRLEDAFEVYSFPSLINHDPFDRMIISTVRINKASLVTSDRRLLDLGFEWILDSSL